MFLLYFSEGLKASRKFYKRYKSVVEEAWSLAFGLIFTAWGVICVFTPSFPGSPWMAFGGLILLIHVGIVAWRSLTIKRHVLGALLSRKGAVKLRSVARELDIDEETLKRVLVDLRGEGKVSFTIDEETGQITTK